ncbi:hypothetical protein ACFOEW_19380 [Alteromonas oceani]|uniref:Uncharacterized protein n=1 Tax=Alteromonas oceani TaxID=2071609 RepID=A0ABV7K0X1_9ALTE|nr:hypothetical protein [Alteromonas oceani]
MQESKKPNYINIFKEILAPAAVLYTMFVVYTAHEKNMENTQKINAMLVKYEQTLDAAIAGDEKTLARFKQNMNKVLDGMSAEEREIMKGLLELNRQGN